MTYESDIEAFFGFGEVVNDARMVIAGYVVKIYGFPFVFRNEKLFRLFHMIVL